MTVTVDRVLLTPVAAPPPRALFWSDLAPSERTLLDVFHQTAAHHPNAPAVADAARSLTYRQLTDEVDALRTRLYASGIGLGDRVGIRIASGTVDLYVAILAVLSAGAAYVPVDADDPRERADLVFAEAAVCAVLGDAPEITHRTPPIGRPGGTPGPDDDAWIIFTSGSTGKPEGRRRDASLRRRVRGRRSRAVPP